MQTTKAVPTCPNCGSQRFTDHFVYKEEKPETVNISFEEYANEKELPFQSMSGDITFLAMKKPIQLVVKCLECGFTLVKSYGEPKCQ